MPDNFTPLSHEELRELWIESKPDPYDTVIEEGNRKRVRHLVLSAIWWEAMDERIGHALDFALAPAAHQKCKLCHRGGIREWFLAKLTEIGIELKEGDDA